MVLNLKEKVFAEVRVELFCDVFDVIVLPVSQACCGNNHIIGRQRHDERDVDARLGVIARDTRFR